MFLMVSKVNINCLNNKFSCITHTILYLKNKELHYKLLYKTCITNTLVSQMKL